MKRFLLYLLMPVSFAAVSQTTSQKTTMTIPKKAVVDLSDIKEDYFVSVQCIEKPVPGGIPQKDPNVNWSGKVNANATTASAGTLTPIFMGRNFGGNYFNNSTPTDNDIAVSNNCKIISVSNTLLYFYDCAVDSVKPVVSLSAFGASLGSLSSSFDPKVAYDPVADRFAVVYLDGFAPASTSVIVGFSQTNNPKGAWNMYALPGNPFNNNLWSDYPMITFSKDEFFITVNLLNPGGSWQTSFKETIIWEIKKKNGYMGQSLTTTLHSNIKYNGFTPRNMCPVKGGSMLYGPNQYFLSSRNFGASTDSLFLIEISDTIAASTQTLTVQKLTTDIPYTMPPDARQVAPHMLATNDARVLGAFIENNKIQYVHNTQDPNTNFCSLFHGVIHSVTTTPTVNGYIIGDPVMDLGYPNISYAGNSASDNTSIINFLHTAPTVSCGMSAMKSDANNNYSAILKLKDGTSYADLLSANLERWGDYSGTARKYNEPGKFWVNGYYGYINGGNRLHATYLAEIGLNFIVTDVNPGTKIKYDAATFPNPTNDKVNVVFEVKNPEYIDFILYDINGKQVKALMKEFLQTGKQEFTFSMSPLPSGVYFLKIFSPNQEFVTKKLIRE